MQCDPEVLWTLVEQQADPDDRSSKVYRHLADCSHCQQTLSELSGGPTWEATVNEWMAPREDDPFGTSPILSADLAEEILLPIDLGFLDTASHPEMLGRLGRYEIESVIGRGGMGLVLRGYDSELQRTVAVKVLAPEWAASQAARQRFAREAQAAASVAHENVIPIHNVQSDAQPPFLVMRYIAGKSLERYVAEAGPLDPAAILRIASQLAAGLSAAHHQGLIHRDVKPANVLVGENVERVWLTDFGLARAADDVRMTRTGVIAGTPHYMSPEQARGQPLDARSDLFSLGGVLYYLCTGRPPFDAATTLGILHQTVTAQPVPLTRARQDLPPRLASLVERLLAKKPSRRPATAKQVGDELQIASEQLTRGLQTRRQSMRRRRLVGAIGALAVVAVGSFTGPYLISVMRDKEGTGQAIDSHPTSNLDTRSQTVQALGDPFEDPWTGTEPDASERQRLTRIAEQLDGIARWNDARWQQQVQQMQRSADRLTQPETEGFFPW